MENSQTRTERTLSFAARRGEIQDRYHYPLSIAVSSYRLKIHPKQLKLTENEAQQLAGILSKDIRKDQALRSEKWFYFNSVLDAYQAKAITAMGLSGIEVESREGRFYPLGKAVSQVIGILGAESKGVLGIEYLFDDYLKGQDGLMRISQNLLGQIHQVFESKQSSDGANLVLSIDARIQQLGWQELEKAVAYHDAEQAAAVILDVESGEVLAMLNYPSFDPNTALKNLDSLTKNLSISELFEPGSIIKPLVMSAILTHKPLDLDAEIEIDEGGLDLGGKIINDHQYFSKLKIKEVLEKSSNIAMVRLAQTLPDGYLIKHLQRLGLFTPSYLSLVGETVGRHREGSQVELATMAYGYGLSMNLVVIARAFNIIANQGKDVGVHMLKDSVRPDSEQVLSSEVAKTVTQMMERVVAHGVSSRNAAVPGISVAGKSGTARKLSKTGEYQKSYVSSFVGFAPSNAPKIVVAVMVDGPKKNGYYGGKVAAPIFSKLMKIALHYHQTKEGLNVRSQRLLPYPAE